MLGEFGRCAFQVADDAGALRVVCYEGFIVEGWVDVVGGEVEVVERGVWGRKYTGL